VGYVSPYLVVTNGGRYTKHIYAGSQRIASKMGDIDAFGADPRRVEYAGADIHEIDFAEKYGKQNGALMARYDSFNVENKPMENNDYVNGKSFCCGGTPLSELSDGNTDEGESADYEENIRLYHVDHLGSTSLVTDIDGEITQHVAYIPYGEIFVEQRNGSWNTPYLFNAKELDEETGLYYYGARYLDPTHAAWLSVDPLFEKYVGMTPYNYCSENPVKIVDPNGKGGVKSEVDGHKMIEENVVIQVYKLKPIRNNMSEAKKSRREKWNNFLGDINKMKIDKVKSDLEKGFANAKNTDGETVEFKFNYIIHETKRPDEIKRKLLMDLYSIKSSEKNRKGGDVWVRPAVFTTNTNNEGVFCRTIADFWVTEAEINAPDLTYAHEAVHTFGVPDNGYRQGGLLGNPPAPISPKEVDAIWKKCRWK
jgi:RHS repeat-associated protein